MILTLKDLKRERCNKREIEYAITDNDTGICNWDFCVRNALSGLCSIQNYFLNFEINCKCH